MPERRLRRNRTRAGWECVLVFGDDHSRIAFTNIYLGKKAVSGLGPTGDNLLLLRIYPPRNSRPTSGFSRRSSPLPAIAISPDTRT